MFITFEGIDGAGKSSHIAGVVDFLREQGREVVSTREPGGTPLAEKLRAIGLNDAMDPLTEALLMFAARRDHLVQLIEPALARGAVVVCDRFTDSTFAYQGGGRGFDLSVLTILETMVQSRSDGQGIRQPDLTLWFDLPPAVAATRLAGARVPDKFEQQPVEFFTAVSNGYRRRASVDPHRFEIINADQKRDAVWLETIEAIQRRVPECERAQVLEKAARNAS